MVDESIVRAKTKNRRRQFSGDGKSVLSAVNKRCLTREVELVLTATPPVVTHMNGPPVLDTPVIGHVMAARTSAPLPVTHNDPRRGHRLEPTVGW